MSGEFPHVDRGAFDLLGGRFTDDESACLIERPRSIIGGFGTHDHHPVLVAVCRCHGRVDERSADAATGGCQQDDDARKFHRRVINTPIGGEANHPVAVPRQEHPPVGSPDPLPNRDGFGQLGNDLIGGARKPRRLGSRLVPRVAEEHAKRAHISLDGFPDHNPSDLVRHDPEPRANTPTTYIGTYALPRASSGLQVRLSVARIMMAIMPVTIPVTRLPVLRPVSIFRGLKKATLLEVARKSVEVTYPAGSTVVRQGDPGDALYIVTKGTVEVYRDDRVVAERTAGAYFGEISLIDGEPRSATVVAVDDIVLLRLGSSDFDSLLNVPYVARTVMKNLARLWREAQDSRGP